MITTKYKISGKLAFQNKPDPCNRRFFVFSYTKTVNTTLQKSIQKYSIKKKKKKKGRPQHITQQQLIKHKPFRWDVSLFTTCPPKTVPGVSWCLEVLPQQVQQLLPKLSLGLEARKQVEAIMVGSQFGSGSCLFVLRATGCIYCLSLTLFPTSKSRVSRKQSAFLSRVLERLILLSGQA